MICPICGQLPGDPMKRPFGCFGRGERECTLRVSEALGKHGRPLAWAADDMRRELADAKADVERLRDRAARYHYELRTAEREADELRRLAWEWCIEARRQCESVLWLLQRVGDDESPPAYSEAMAEEAGPLPTAVLAQTEAPIDLRIPTHQVPTFALREPEPPIYIDPAHEPIESLGPVPVSTCDVEFYDHKIRGVLAWLLRDAVRRGAKLEVE